ncbi:MAG: chemotaxis protein CheW [Myxococcota bacterium]
MVRLGADPWALPLDALVAVERPRRIAPLPGAPPPVVGLAVRLGRLLPVFDLRRVVGVPPEQEVARYRWWSSARAPTSSNLRWTAS